MEKFRYRKQIQNLQDEGSIMQNQFGEVFLQEGYSTNETDSTQHVEYDKRYLKQDVGRDLRLQLDQQFLQSKRHHEQHFGQSQRQHDQQYDHNQKQQDQQFGHNQKQQDQQFGHNQKQQDQQFGHNRNHLDKQKSQNQRLQHDQSIGQNRRQNDQQFGPIVKQHDQHFGQSQRQCDKKIYHDKHQQQNQQFNHDHKQQQSEDGHRQKQQQPLKSYVSNLRDPETMKQHTDWNRVMQDLFGIELPQTAESTHESASSGIASDVTSVYPSSTPSTSALKCRDSSISSAKSTVSRDSGTKSVSGSGSPGPDQTFEKTLPKGTRIIPTIPRNGPPILGKITQHTSSWPHNGHHQVNDFSIPPSGYIGEKKNSREHRNRHIDPNCIQCSNSLSCMSYKHHIHNRSSFNDCRAVDPSSFCCELDQCFVDHRGDDYFIDSFGEDRFIEYPPLDKSSSRDMLHISSPMSPRLSPGFCCGQSVHQNNHDLYLHSEKAPQNLQIWHKHQQLQHNHQSQQYPPQIRYSPMDSDNNCSTTFDICNNHNHNLPMSSQSGLKEHTSSPILQTFKPNIPMKPHQAQCHYQASKQTHHLPHDDNEKHPETVLPRSQTSRESQILITQAQVHTPSPQPRSWNDNKIRSPHIQTESQVSNFLNKQQFGKDGDLSRYLVTGINNLSLNQTDKTKGKTNIMSSNCKRLTTKVTPFEYLPNDVLMKIFGHLSTDHLCRCAQVCRLWYNVVWDNPILWTTIAINNDKIDIDRALKYLTRRLSYNTPKVCMILEKINVNNCCRLTDRGLQTVAKRCPELRYLDMQSCHLITNLGVKEAVSRCVNLERLDVTDCPLVTCLSLMDSLISQSASRHLQRIYLRYLDMTDCPNVTDEDLCITTSQCTQLLFLYLRRCPLITDLGVTYIANNCCSLRELSLSDCKSVTDLGMRELAKLRENLRYLSVAKCEKVSDQGVIHIAKNCSKLRYLNVRGCEAFSDTGLDFLARNCPRLRSLDIGKCDITDDGLYALSMHSPNLRKLGMKSCDAITDKGIVMIAYRCSSLQQLHVQDCCLSPDAYAMVRKYCKRAIIEHTNPAIL